MSFSRPHDEDPLLPEGLIYVPGFLTEAGERDVLAVLATFDLHPYVLRHAAAGPW